MESLQVSEQSRPAMVPDKCHVLVFTSGKGGVGKTCVTTNVASAMVHRGARVCIFDADTGLANINILLGLKPEFTLEHVLNGEKSINDIVLKTSEGIAVVPGASGIADCANISREEANRLVSALSTLEAEYDYILIDTAAGVSDSVLHFIESAPCAFLIITSEPTSLTDAFSLLKMLNAGNYTGRLRVVINLAVDYPSATETYRRFASAVEKYLKLKVEYGGFVARDENVPRSVALQLPVVEMVADSPASRCLYALADNVLKYIGSEEVESGLAGYWSNVLAEIETSKKEGDRLPLQPQTNRAEGNATEPKLDVTVPETSSADIPQKLLSMIKSRSFEKSKLEAFIGQCVTLFVEQHGSFPQSFRQLFYRWLESENYAAPRLLELITTLESLYTIRYQQPLFNLEDSVARLVAQTQGTEAKFRELVNQLRSAYHHAFQVDVYDARKEVLELIRLDDFTEESFEELLQSLKNGFNTRFNKPYLGQSELLLESTADELVAMASEEKKLLDEIDVLALDFQQLTMRRDALLTAIKAARERNQHKSNCPAGG